MKNYSHSLATVVATHAWAAIQTVVPSMAACPFTVKKARSTVWAEMSFDKREAIITFDDAKVSVAALTNASENAGYPASLKEHDHE